MIGRTYVALDLETTGLDPTRDAILEVGAVRIENNRIVDRFSTLINPLRPVPPRITQITGIRDADIVDAPTFDSILPELLAFVSADVSAIVAHNATFDLSFLRANAVNFARPAHDTFDLATILLPGQASYSLGELCHHLGVPLVDAHRALDDAEATGNLFIRLVQRIELLPPEILQPIVQASANSDWPLHPLFADAAFASPVPLGAPVAHAALDRDLPNPVPSLVSDAGNELMPIARQEVVAAFADGGPLADLMGDSYEPRSGQIDMAGRVADALNRGDHLLIEAGTGTGKSLAYLIPAALWSINNQRRVVIATNTIPLQDQLLAKDIPQAQSVVAALNQTPPRAALLKGRANYLCLHRMAQWQKSHPLSSAELTMLARLLVWLPTTRTGDVSELVLPTPTDREIWQQICSDPAICSPEICGPEAGNAHFDFYALARLHAESAHLLVVNHALLLADIAAEGRVLPPYTHLIVDEAHRLEESATDQLTFRFDWPNLHAMLKRLRSQGDLSGALLRSPSAATLPRLDQRLNAIALSAETALNSCRVFHDRLLSFALHHDEARSDNGYTQRLSLDSRTRGQPAWSELEIDWEHCSTILRTLIDQVGRLTEDMRSTGWDESASSGSLVREVVSIHGELSNQIAHLDDTIWAPDGVSQNGRVTWIEVNESRNQVAILAAPMHVSDLLQREIVHRRRSAIFTGATLRSGANFRFLRERIGLWDVPTAMVDSPFDYKSSTLLFMPSDLMQPNHPAYQSGVERAIIKAAEACGGRSLVLFTSNAALRATADAVRAPLERLGISVLQQGAGNRHRLLREYRASERAVLLGARSFWEGVDLPGDELRCLLIAKLPFSVPNDPLIAARSSECEDAFHDYMLPDAVLRFRQGFGRLIRRASDRGVIVLLDSRIWRREYGQSFLDALPPCTVRNAPLSLLGTEIQQWLSK